jgi:hypothetical protein
VPRPSSRLTGVDLARCVALLGMVAVHVLPLSDAAGDPTLVDRVAGGRSAALFAVLAGVSLALAFGPSPRLLRAGPALVVRGALVGLVGLLLGLLDSGVAVILAYYAVLFVLAVPFLRARAGVLSALAAATAVGLPLLSFAVRDDLPARDPDNPSLATLDDPGGLLAELLLTGYYPALPWLAYLLAGLAAGRLALASRRTALELAGAGALLALAAAAASAALLGPGGGYDEIAAAEGLSDGEVERKVDAARFGNVPLTTPWWLATDAAHTTTPFDLLHTTGTALLALGVALLLAPLAPRLLSPLTAAGSMPLTLYTAHVTWLGLTDAEDPERSYLLQVAVGLAFAWVWRDRVGRGPLESVVALAVRPLRGTGAKGRT